MARRKAPKNINLLRAVYGVNARSLQHYVNAACTAVATLTAREVGHPTHGSLRINFHVQDRNGLFVHLVAKTSGEAASTVVETRGVHNDAETLVAPPVNRSFKSADLFALIRGDNLCICADGIRVPAFEYYLKNFFQNAGQSNNSVQFDLRHVQNAEKVAILVHGGVKEIRLSGTLFNATAEHIEDASIHDGSSMLGIVDSVKNQLAALFEKDDDRELQDHADEMQVEVIVKARGGSRAEPVVLRKLEEAGIALVEDGGAFGYEIRTNNNKKMTPGELVVFHPVVLERGEGSNSLQRTEVFDKLIEAMTRFDQDGDLEL